MIIVHSIAGWQRLAFSALFTGGDGATMRWVVVHEIFEIHLAVCASFGALSLNWDMFAYIPSTIGEPE